MGKTKTIGRKNPIPPPPPTFENEQAELRFRDVVAKKSCCAEKGFLLKQIDSGMLPEFVTSVINRNGWRKLCEHPMSACVPLGREFYSHLHSLQQETVYVRGIHVRVNSALINQYFEIPEGRDEHREFEESLTDEEFDQIVDDLCVAGTKCTKSQQGALTFLRGNLKPAVKVWYHFLRFSLMPTGHLQTVSKERALLLHSIMNGRRINVGRVIHQELVDCALKQKGRLYFPCFLTSFCNWARVPSLEEEEQLFNTGAITKIAIHRITQDVAAPEEEEEAGPSTAAPSEAAPSTATGATETPQLDQRLSAIETTQQTILEELQQIQQDQRTYWSYMERWTRAHQRNMQANSTRFFNFPLFPDQILHPPEDRDNMEE